jgi:hypothetical protein
VSCKYQSLVDNYGYATLFSHGKCCTNALNAMMTNIENNGAPWQYNQQDRIKLERRKLVVKNRISKK